MTRHIQISKKIPLFGAGDTLESRLRRVVLRGFPDVAIYKDAVIIPKRLAATDIPHQLYTPQPHVHQTFLDRITELANLFAKEGIDIFHLDAAYDYLATDQSGEQTNWTMIPPVVERFALPPHQHGGFDYAPLIGKRLQAVMDQNGWHINPQTTNIKHHNTSGKFSLINDGSHRVHAGLQNGGGITVLEITNTAPGYPYYAAPQEYARVRVFPNNITSEDLKIHVLTSPGHKQLYRLFPSGGIMTGEVRPAREGEVFV